MIAKGKGRHGEPKTARLKSTSQKHRAHQNRLAADELQRDHRDQREQQSSGNFKTGPRPSELLHFKTASSISTISARTISQCSFESTLQNPGKRNDGSEESMRVVLTDDHLEHDLPDSPELVFSRDQKGSSKADKAQNPAKSQDRTQGASQSPSHVYSKKGVSKRVKAAGVTHNRFGKPIKPKTKHLTASKTSGMASRSRSRPRTLPSRAADGQAPSQRVRRSKQRGYGHASPYAPSKPQPPGSACSARSRRDVATLDRKSSGRQDLPPNQPTKPPSDIGGASKGGVIVARGAATKEKRKNTLRDGPAHPASSPKPADLATQHKEPQTGGACPYEGVRRELKACAAHSPASLAELESLWHLLDRSRLGILPLSQIHFLVECRWPVLADETALLRAMDSVALHEQRTCTTRSWVDVSEVLELLTHLFVMKRCYDMVPDSINDWGKRIDLATVEVLHEALCPNDMTGNEVSQWFDMMNKAPGTRTDPPVPVPVPPVVSVPTAAPEQQQLSSLTSPPPARPTVLLDAAARFFTVCMFYPQRCRISLNLQALHDAAADDAPLNPERA